MGFPMNIENKIDEISAKIDELYSELATIAVENDTDIYVDSVCGYSSQTIRVVTPSFYQELISRGYCGEGDIPLTECDDEIEVGTWISSTALC